MSEQDPSRSAKSILSPLGAGISVSILALSVLSVPLAAASQLGLSQAETTSWILGLYGLPGALSLLLVLRYRQPLLVTGNVFIMIFVASLATDLSWPELIGAAVAAGALVLIIGGLGLTDRLAVWLPPPIVFGLLAGAVVPFFIDLFVALDREPLSIAVIIAAYMLGAFVFRGRLPAILPALIVGLVVAVLEGGLGFSPEELSFPAPALTLPHFSVDALLTATPVMVVLVTLQANVPSMVFLRGQAYLPPARLITGISGTGTLLGSLLGPVGVSLSLPASALVAGPDAGEHGTRYRAGYVAASAHVAIGLLAGLAAAFAAGAPQALLDAVVGIAVIGVLVNALREATRGPLVFGPMFAFAVSQSGLSLFGLGAFFWALALGLAASFLLERDGWKELRGLTET